MIKKIMETVRNCVNVVDDNVNEVKNEIIKENPIPIFSGNINEERKKLSEVNTTLYKIKGRIFDLSRENNENNKLNSDLDKILKESIKTKNEEIGIKCLKNIDSVKLKIEENIKKIEYYKNMAQEVETIVELQEGIIKKLEEEKCDAEISVSIDKVISSEKYNNQNYKVAQEKINECNARIEDYKNTDESVFKKFKQKIENDDYKESFLKMVSENEN